ncbi:hypothetical protein TGRUB_251530 [Toxoplasma gondii RUB]|uniref:Uncharacterized protein n=1 Tax=Toxoplasma gondii RUB TaxID=935652 RepID=A0A086LM01_TOXGO|nr:hypothetical protein TGRUB_251530 [Toxoplasma gondii RUB]
MNVKRPATCCPVAVPVLTHFERHTLHGNSPSSVGIFPYSQKINLGCLVVEYTWRRKFTSGGHLGEPGESRRHLLYPLDGGRCTVLLSMLCTTPFLSTCGSVVSPVMQPRAQCIGSRVLCNSGSV